MLKKISLAEARQLAIHSQWLNHNNLMRGKADVLRTIEHLGYAQIDTLAVVERAHHHVLWSRVPDYQTRWLDELTKEKKIFEYWSHAASFLSMKDYRFSLIRKREYAKGKSHWFEQDKKLKRYVLARIKREGPLQSKDFESAEEAKRSWYYWKPAKRALEQLFMEGKLMVSYRQGFQKVYDLAERVLPGDADTKLPSKTEYAEYLVMTAIQSHGIVSEKEIYYNRGAWNDLVKKVVRKMLKVGIISEVKLEGHEQTNFFGYANVPEQMPSAITSDEVHILSPFDNLIIQRRRMQRLFNFDFVIECYLPEHKRKFGYFTMPVLFGDQFVARMDPKADRLTKTFYIRNLVFEPGLRNDEELLPAFASKLKAFMKFNGCEKIVIEKSNQKKLSGELNRLLKK